jgi:hypothetical protein
MNTFYLVEDGFEHATTLRHWEGQVAHFYFNKDKRLVHLFRSNTRDFDKFVFPLDDYIEIVQKYKKSNFEEINPFRYAGKFIFRQIEKAA